MHPSPTTPGTPSPSASSATLSASSAVPLSSPPSLSALSSVSSVPSVGNRSASASSAFPVTPAADDASDPDADPRTRTRREEAFTLYCHGYRSPAIAQLLGVPQRTVRSWIAATLQASADESRTRRDQQLRLAIESQRAIVQAAWHAFDRAARAERLTLEHLQDAVPFTLDADDELNPYAPTSPPQRRGGQGVRTPSLSLPRLPTVGARYLQIVLHAQREIARLSGLYDLPDSFFDPNAGRPMQIVISRHPNLPPNQLLAWAAFREQWNADHPTDPIPPEDLVFPPEGAPHHDFTPEFDDPDDPDDPDEAPSRRYDGYPNAAPVTDERDHATGDDPAAMPGDGPARDLHPHSTSPAQLESAAETAMPADLQPAQAGFVAERPVGADSSARAPSPPVAGDDPGVIPPALLPRFRRRPGAPSPQSLSYWNRGAP